MTAYNKSDIDSFNRNRQLAPDNERRSGESSAEFNRLFPYPFYSPSLFVRIGLFFLTLFTVLLVFALLWLISGTPGSSGALGTLSFLIGSACLFAAEYFARKRKHYQSGIDEALHCSIVVLFSLGAGSWFDFPEWLVVLVAACISTVLFLRYLSNLVAGIAVILLFAALTLCFQQFVSSFIYAMPLSLLALAAYYFIVHRKNSIPEEFQSGILCIRYCLLVCAVFFSNYVCVAGLGERIFPDPFLTILYKAATICIPALILLFGILRKELEALHVAMLAIVFAVYSIYVFSGRNYPFIWMTVCGAVFSAVSVLLMKWLKTPRGGFIYEHRAQSGELNWTEILVAANAPSPDTPPPGGFGGGDFGGGGATGSY